jgi:ribosomal protein L11 methyltransferase
VIVGGEAELLLLLHIFPEGVEELDGAYAVYADEPPLGFDVVQAEDVREGWEDAWRAFHHGVVVGRLWVGPPWEQPPVGVTPVVVDPGRAFGTGAHPTTRLCLELLQEIESSSLSGGARSAEQASLLDIGCGSGVLSIAAAKLGFAPVIGIDVDDAAVEATLANARANRVEVAATRVDALVDELPETAVVVANIALEPVEQLLPRVAAACVVTSGYLERDTPEPAGRRQIARRTADGWAADLLAV